MLFSQVTILDLPSLLSILQAQKARFAYSRKHAESFNYHTVCSQKVWDWFQMKFSRCLARGYLRISKSWKPEMGDASKSNGITGSVVQTEGYTGARLSHSNRPSLTVIPQRDTANKDDRWFFSCLNKWTTEKQQLIFALAAAREKKKQTKGPPAHHSQHYYYNYYHNAFTLKRRHLRQATKAAGSVSLPPSHDFPPPSHSACVMRREVRTERQSQRKKRRVGGSEKPFYNWVTWKCQRWGASFFPCDAHKHLLPHTPTWTHFPTDTFFFSVAFRVRRPCRCFFFSSSLVKSLFSYYYSVLWSERKGKKVAVSSASRTLERPHGGEEFTAEGSCLAVSVLA